MIGSDLAPETLGWMSVRVDAGWPPTWERPHCGLCDAPWWTLEKRGARWVLWRLPSRAAYDYGCKCGSYVSPAQATRFVTERAEDMIGEVCLHD